LHYINILALILFNLFGAVFRGQWLLIACTGSIFFYTSAYLINIFKDKNDQLLLLGLNLLFVAISLTIAYFVRWLLAKAFTFQILAE
jgi:hypothetical protein